MLAFNQLGNLGRLGNQMFQYAAVRGIAAMRGYQFGIPPHDAKRVDNYSLGRAFKLDSVGPSNLHVLDRGHAPVVVEKHFHFDEELHRMCPNDVSLFGFFQSEKYFANIKDEILRDFTFHDSIWIPAKRWSIRWIKSLLSFFMFVGVILTLSMLGDLSGRTRNVRRNIHHNQLSYYEKFEVF